jgi:diguanylate cyclase (GGDEF)-like protein
MGVVASLVLSVIVVVLAVLFLLPQVDVLGRYSRLVFFLLLVGLTVVFTLVVFILLTRWFVDRPIEELIRVVTVAPTKDFLNRAAVRSGDVVGRLAQSFNRLLERITTLDAFKLETERQLIVAQEELKYKEALEEKNKKLSLLYEFTQQVSMTLELDELYNIVESFIGDKLGFREFAFLVYEEESQSLVVKVARGFADQAKVRGMSFRAGEGITGRVLKQGVAVYLPDTRRDPEYLYYKGEKREDGSFLSIPLVFKKKVVGVLNMTRPGIDQFSDEEVRFLNTLVTGLAIALVNAKLYSRTRELSVRDELTQLYNRRHFQEMLPLEIKRSQRFRKPLSLLMIDVDHFKRFNDRYGHLAGDELLKELVHLIASRIREVDFFARFGGEEFVLILPNTPKKDAVKVADKLRLLVRDHRFPGNGGEKPERLTVSIGVASYPDDAQMMEELVDAADIALYEAKGGGRDRVIGYDSGEKSSQDFPSENLLT